MRDPPARTADRWGAGPPAGADELDQLVYLSNLIGREPALVQPGGGNSSIKLGDVLLVKASGTDLRTIGRDGFARLSLPELGALASAAANQSRLRIAKQKMIVEIRIRVRSPS